jgi:hypothetical protein
MPIVITSKAGKGVASKKSTSCTWYCSKQHMQQLEITGT